MHEKMTKHPLEAGRSYELYLERRRLQATSKDANEQCKHRQLKKHHHKKKERQFDDIEKGDEIERKKEKEHWAHEQKKQEEKAKEHRQEAKEFRENINELYNNTGIKSTHVHGMMIDAGSKGSRIHLYEWKPRVLRSNGGIEAAVSGRKLSFPGSDTRWTDRIKPGIDTFAYLSDHEMVPAIANYLFQFLDFAKTILHDQVDDWGKFPIFLRATGGMRIVDTKNRARVLQAVRDLFSNHTYCPFAFTKEQARVISGEEEAIYDWTNVNFLLGVLISESEGAGTVIDPKLTYGALDLGGASTQISFYEPNEDIMSNLFKLQIGQGRHWNLYAHSFLHYGILEAQRRFEARLADGQTSAERLIEGIHNPCLPGGSKREIRTNVHINRTTGLETFYYTNEYAAMKGYYNAVLKNDHATGDFEGCLKATRALLNLQQNSWCEYSHNGECSFAGVYQPQLPTQEEEVGSFLAFSNYRHVWDFLQLEDVASLNQLLNATKFVCSLSKEDYIAFNNGKVDADEVEDYCFRSAFVFNLLHNGYGFGMDDNITSVEVINGQKVGWALGAMLYEINTMPWTFESHEPELPVFENNAVFDDGILVLFVCLAVLGFVTSAILFYKLHRSHERHAYETIN